MGIEEKFPVRKTAFDGAARVTQDQPISMADYLNDLAGAGNRVNRIDANTVAVAGGDTPSIEIDGDSWSAVAADWSIMIGKYAATVATVTQAAGLTTLTLAASPALSDYSAAEMVNVQVKGKAAGRAEWLAVGAISIETV